MIGTAFLLLGALAVQDRPPAVSIRVDPPAQSSWARGTPVKVYLRTDRAAYVTVFRADTEGRLSILYPEHPWENNYLNGGRTYEITAGGTSHAFSAEFEPGLGYLFAVASEEPFDYRKVVRGERWDRASFFPEGRITGDPYASFTDLAEQILTNRAAAYGSALVAYRVEGQYDYPRFVCYDCHAPNTHPVWDPYQRTCPRFALVRYSDPKAGYRYGFRDRRAPAERSPGDWISGVPDLRRLIPWLSRPQELPREPERAAAPEPWLSPILRNLTPRLERRSPVVAPQPADSPPLQNQRRRRPPQ
ncbi:hypothetical protein HRbin33_02692 [bacterium HR33]|nr:hypothetical protein HRbin33_02692 [bacterium HR33]